MSDTEFQNNFNYIKSRLRCIETKLDDHIAGGGGGTTHPDSSASGIDALWTFQGQAANPLVLPNEPHYIYTFHRNGIEQDESQYDITGTSLTVFPPLGSTNGGRDEILELRYKYIN